MTEERRFVVAQRLIGGRWRQYLCAWMKSGERSQDGAGDPRAFPLWHVERDQALKLDELTARQLVDQFDARYGQTEGARVVQHLVEELS